MMWVALKRAGCVARSQYVFEVTSLCLYAYMQPCLPLVDGFVDDALPSSKCQCFRSSMSHFSFCVTSGSRRHRRFWYATPRLRSAICQHHPLQRAVLSQICCFGKRKVVFFQILLDGCWATMWGRPGCLLQSAGGGLPGSSWHLRCRPRA